jgi:hypothetical protein
MPERHRDSDRFAAIEARLRIKSDSRRGNRGQACREIRSMVGGHSRNNTGHRTSRGRLAVFL